MKQNDKKLTESTQQLLNKESLPTVDHLQLDDEQQAAVESPIGISVIEAIAGSGKTRTLIYRIKNLIDYGVDPSKIAMITFTRSAADEMFERLATLLGVSSEELYIQNGTFHSLAVEQLRRVRGYKYINIIDPLEDEDLLKEQVYMLTEDNEQELKQIQIGGTDKYSAMRLMVNIRELQESFSHAANNLLTIDELISDYDYGKNFPYETTEIRVIHSLYSDRKDSESLVNYDDILVKLLKNIEHEIYGPLITESIDHVLVDEYQDINEIQFRIIQALTSDSLFAIGDKAQAIYNWRGSKPSYIYNFEKFFPSAKRYTIENNYRCGQSILERAQHMINRNIEAYGRLNLNHTKDGGLVTVSCYHDRYDESLNIAKNIKREYTTNGKEYNNQAILVRNRESMASLEQALLNENIPYSLAGGQDFYTKAIVRDVMAWMKLLYNPFISIPYNRALSALRGIGDKKANDIRISFMKSNCDIDTFQMNYKTTNSTKESIEIFADLYRRRDEHPRDIFEHIKNLFYLEKVRKKNTKKGTLIEKKYKSDLGVLDELAELFQRSNSLQDVMEEVELSENREEHHDDRVIISTMHMAKGLEWDIVYTAGWNEWFDTRPSSSRDENIEQVNLAYVTMTRAKEQLHISYPIKIIRYGDMIFTHPSSFLKTLTNDVVELPISYLSVIRQNEPLLIRYE